MVTPVMGFEEAVYYVLFGLFSLAIAMIIYIVAKDVLRPTREPLEVNSNPSPIPVPGNHRFAGPQVVNTCQQYHSQGQEQHLGFSQEEYQGAIKRGVRKYFFYIKENVSSDWKDLAFHLGFRQSDIMNIEGRNRDHNSCTMDLLEEWLKHNGERATIGVLMEALSGANLQDVVDCLKYKFVELKSPSLAGPALPVCGCLHVDEGLLREKTPEWILNRIRELEHELVTPDMLMDPERLSKVKQALREYKAFLIELQDGSVILLLQFLCQRDLDRFFHNCDNIGEGTLSHVLSRILIPSNIQNEFEGVCEGELIVRLHVKYEDYLQVSDKLGKDPRTWDPVEVTQWVARTLLSHDQTATIPDLQMTGAEICARPETWFTDKFPPGKGRILYSDLQQQRDDVLRQRKYGGRQEELERVVERTSATFLVSAYLMSMMLTLLGQHREKAECILEYLQVLIRVIKRRSKNKGLIHAGNFNHQWARHSIIQEGSLSSSGASVVFGSRAIAISGEAYSQVVTSAAEAMEVIGAPLEIKIKPPWWKRFAAVAAVVIGNVVVAFAGPLVAVVAGIVTAAAAYGVNKFLIVAFGVLDESEKKTAHFKVNYLQSLILLPKVLGEMEMEEEKFNWLIAVAQAEGEHSSIRDVERHMIQNLPQFVSRLSPSIQPSRIQHEAHFHYMAKDWLTEDSIPNINDTMIIAYAQFQLRHLLRDVFILGVVGSEHSGKSTVLKSVIQRAHQTKSCPYDVKMYDGSNDFGESSLPILLFPSGQGKEVDAANKLCTGVCAAFICVVEYVAGGTPDIGALARVAHLSAPVLLCVNKCGGLQSHREAHQILDMYKSAVSTDFRSLDRLTEVVLTDFQTTDGPAWLTGAQGVKCWIEDAIQNHKSFVSNA